jgi:hypothetical protein
MLVALLLAPGLAAQEKPQDPALESPGAPLKVEIVFTETQGERKISSLPYQLHILSGDARGEVPRFAGKLRMGLRVPVPVGKEGQFQYMDVGTNIDCSAQRMRDGRYKLNLSLQRSTTYAPEGQRPAGSSEVPVATVMNPIIGQFSSEINLLLGDGQTMQSIISTDPVSGRTLRVDVTLKVVK